MVAAKKFDTLRLDIASQIRTDAKSLRGDLFWTEWSTTSEGEVVVASGRARCRVCSEKIKKGDASLKVFMDQGGGTWSAVHWHLHQEPCPAQQETQRNTNAS